MIIIIQPDFWDVKPYQLLIIIIIQPDFWDVKLPYLLTFKWLLDVFPELCWSTFGWFFG